MIKSEDIDLFKRTWQCLTETTKFGYPKLSYIAKYHQK